MTPVLMDDKLRQLLTSKPCQFGYEANTWTVPLLAAHLRYYGAASTTNARAGAVGLKGCGVLSVPPSGGGGDHGGWRRGIGGLPPPRGWAAGVYRRGGLPHGREGRGS